jgi:hypothetical protein
LFFPHRFPWFSTLQTGDGQPSEALKCLLS